MRKRDIDKYAEKGRQIIGNKPDDMRTAEMGELYNRANACDGNGLFNAISTAFYMGVHAGYNRGVKSAASNRVTTVGEVLNEAQAQNMTIEEYLESIK